MVDFYVFIRFIIILENKNTHRKSIFMTGLVLLEVNIITLFYYLMYYSADYINNIKMMIDYNLT